MARITGVIYIDIETDKSISQEQFNDFEREISQIIDKWEESVYDAANNNGFEYDDIRPILLDSLECDFD